MAGVRLLGDYKLTWTTSRIDVAGGEADIPARSHHVERLGLSLLIH